MPATRPRSHQRARNFKPPGKPGPAVRALVWLLAAAVLAGCTSPAEPSQPVQPTAQPGPADTTPLLNGSAPEPAPNRTFAPVEHTFSMDHYASWNIPVPVEGASGDSGNMAEATWDVPVPEGATMVSVTANFTNAITVGTMSLMLHNGTAAAPGSPAFAEVQGNEAPLLLGPLPVPEGLANLVLMFHVAGDLVAVQQGTEAVVVAAFA